MNKLVWEQDFTSEAADLKLWNIRLGNDLLDNDGNPVFPGWGNGEQQFYTGHRGNLSIGEEGLQLCARREVTEQEGRSFEYTSARLDTKNHFAYCYGRLVVRAKLPVGQGLWPAIWLLPQDQAYGPWPASGEIDILEAKGRLPRHIAGTLHYGPDLEHKVVEEFTHELERGMIDEFREYALEWDEGSIRWLVDGHCFAERRLEPGVMPFDQPFYLLLNLAVGGWYDHVEVDLAVFPAVMTVSSIRLYQN
ncbi:glycoside hydrolase family 16 protein [Paenibacillus tritici]|uniref:Glycoside hydrolase family 16 protein n=1 Tax=Paenibacillus tritici TaxID=1873425 RepID=A0ABX2DX70_9BACL|nr:glycoside hydrolase family 16 protein [Paenibacillus tritici]NQX49177.1 glycoside hydrolase family 16 protein [Paenibacillus tritici]